MPTINQCFFFLFCVWCKSICAHVCLYMRAWRPERGILCLPQLLSILFFEIGSLGESGAHWFSYTDWFTCSRDAPVSAPQCWDCRHLPSCLSFLYECWESKLRSPWIGKHSKLFTYLAACPAPHSGCWHTLPVFFLITGKREGLSFP